MAETIITKQCSKCQETKPILEFSKDSYSKDGFQHWCKACASIYRKSKKGKQSYNRYYYSERGKAIRKSYFQSEHGKEIQKPAHKRYRQSEKGKQGLKKYIKSHFLQIKARQAVMLAIREFRLPKPDKFQCSCRDQAEEYHHPSYTTKRWLDVVPVCIKCHKKIHKSGFLSKRTG